MRSLQYVMVRVIWSEPDDLAQLRRRLDLAVSQAARWAAYVPPAGGGPKRPYCEIRRCHG